MKNLSERLETIEAEVQRLGHMRGYIQPQWDRLQERINQIERYLTSFESTLADLDRENRFDFKSGDRVSRAGAEYLVMSNKGGYGVVVPLDEKGHPGGPTILDFQWEAAGHKTMLIYPGG